MLRPKSIWRRSFMREAIPRLQGKNDEELEALHKNALERLSDDTLEEKERAWIRIYLVEIKAEQCRRRELHKLKIKVKDPNILPDHFQRAKMGWKRLEFAKLQGANLSGMDLSGADLRGAKLTNANLEGADLRGSLLSCTDLKGANLKGALLEGAKLGHVRNPPVEIFDLVIEYLKKRVEDPLPYFRPEPWTTLDHIFEDLSDEIKALKIGVEDFPDKPKKEYKKILNGIHKEVKSKISLRHKAFRAWERLKDF